MILLPRSEEVPDALAETMNDPMTQQRRALLLIRRMIDMFDVS